MNYYIRVLFQFGYDLQFALAEMPQYLKQDRVYNTFLLSSQKLAEKYDQDTSLITRRQYQNREDAWRLSNGLPQQYNTFKFIKLDADGNALYDFVEPMLNRATLDAMGNNKPTDLAVDKENLVMGNYPLKVGNDNIGSYIEYTDVWDLTVGTAKAPSNVNNTALTLARKVVQGAIGATQQPFTVKNKVYKALTYDQSGNEVIYYTQNVDNVDIKFYNDFMSKLNNIEASEQYSTEATIKEDIPELFESNPELANAVYEALGFGQKLDNNKKLSIEELDRIIYNNNLRPELFPDLKSLHNNSARLKGFNIAPDKAAIYFLKNILIEANRNQSEIKTDIENIKDLIERAIVSIEKADYSKATQLGEQALSKLHDDVSRFIINQIKENLITYPVAEINQITPQQKQQAQQLYSQYLDTIFPDSKVKKYCLSW